VYVINIGVDPNLIQKPDDRPDVLGRGCFVALLYDNVEFFHAVGCCR